MRQTNSSHQMEDTESKILVGTFISNKAELNTNSQGKKHVNHHYI